MKDQGKKKKKKEMTAMIHGKGKEDRFSCFVFLND